MKAQMSLRLPDAVHQRLERVGRALDALDTNAPPGSEPTSKTDVAKRALLTGLAQVELQLGLETPKPSAPSKAKRGAK